MLGRCGREGVGWCRRGAWAVGVVLRLLDGVGGGGGGSGGGGVGEGDGVLLLLLLVMLLGESVI